MVRQTSQRTWRYTYSASFYSHLSIPPSTTPCCSSPLIREGVLTSPDAEVWPGEWSGGFQGPIWYSPSMSVYVCTSGCVYCLRYEFRRLGEGCASDKGCWLSLADPHGPFASCQSHGPRGGGFSIRNAPARARPAGYWIGVKKRVLTRAWSSGECGRERGGGGAFLKNNTESMRRKGYPLTGC